MQQVHKIKLETSHSLTKLLDAPLLASPKTEIKKSYMSSQTKIQGSNAKVYFSGSLNHITSIFNQGNNSSSVNSNIKSILEIHTTYKRNLFMSYDDGQFFPRLECHVHHLCLLMEYSMNFDEKVNRYS